MKICSNCIIPENFPGYRFVYENNRFLCHKCYELMKNSINLNRLKQNWEKIYREINKQNLTKNNKYHAILFYSGGKDSTATLSLLIKKYRLKILAYTLDNGLKGDSVLNNIYNVTNTLGADLYIQRIPPSKIILDDISQGNYPCGKECNVLQDYYFEEISALFHIPYVITGYEIAPRSRGVMRKEKYTLISFPALLNLSREDSSQICMSLPWKELDYFDENSQLPGMSDCFAPCIALENYCQRETIRFEFIDESSLEFKLFPYLSDRIRYGTVERDIVLRILSSPIKASKIAHKEYEKCINTLISD